MTSVPQLFDEAQDLHQAGRLADARTRYMRILAAAPHHAPTLHMLGLMAYQVGQHDVAVDLLTRAAARDPGSAALHSNLGLALRALGRAEDSEKQFRRAVALDPGLPALHVNLGDAVRLLGRPEEAEACYRRALTLAPGNAELLRSLALMARARGDGDAAMDYLAQALARDDGAASHQVFAEIVQGMHRTTDDDGLRALLVRALAEGWDRPAKFIALALNLVRLRGQLEDDALLHALLRTLPNSDHALEAELTAARRELLLQGGGTDDFAIALAMQCFLNEYVWRLGDDEAAAIARLQARDTPSAAELVALACYRPLGALPEAKLASAPTVLLQQQRDEPAQERALAAAIPQLTPLRDAVSHAVREQYEVNPYPRWARLPQADAPLTLAQFLAARFPLAPLAPTPAAPDFLVAGCGTGQFALELAQRFQLGAVTAIDLSRASLGHAARKAQEAGIAIQFGQADILEIGALGRTFGLIECSGVLHHMADPFAGWRALVACLEPGGVVRAGFYSATARAAVTQARAWIATAGFAPTPEGIRACRAALRRDDNPALRAFLNSADFFTTSACRDLFFHVQEHNLSLDEIAAFLRANGLTLLGLEVSEAVLAAYRARFPGDPVATDLDNWALFERDNPGTFAAMYQFWVQKT
jgi:Flp pilus assembly protein TadD/2-polyprenyl-3-methyl-5-hydroxy-6-metoxy-1,4-benzoquinol methylase